MFWSVVQAFHSLKHGKLGDAYGFLTWTVREKAFEVWYGIDTSEIVSTRALGTDARVSNQYSPTSYHVLHEIFRKVAPRTANEGGAFLDVGCGKGRVLVVAAAFSYEAVYGIEISESLVALARKNLDRAKHRRRCQKAEVFVADAARWSFSDEITTVFIYNSFRGEPLVQFMENLRRSVERRPRPLTLVFVNPESFDASAYPWLRLKEVLRRFQPSSADSEYGGSVIDVLLLCSIAQGASIASVRQGS